jgi:hypothetical protein
MERERGERTNSFGSGGYSLKPHAGMLNMKGDMMVFFSLPPSSLSPPLALSFAYYYNKQGAAAVVCALRAIVELNLRTNVSVIVPLAEVFIYFNFLIFKFV